jgi:uncharacterized ion transporter superfamily protein YfcC
LLDGINGEFGAAAALAEPLSVAVSVNQAGIPCGEGLCLFFLIEINL